MKRKPFEVTAALQAVGLQVHRHNAVAVAVVSRRPFNVRAHAHRVNPARCEDRSQMKGSRTLEPVNPDHREADAYLLVQDVINSVRDIALRNFLEQVLTHPMVDSALTAEIGDCAVGKTHPIELIRKAAHRCSHAQVRTRKEQDLVFVATVIRGLSSSLGAEFCCKTDQETGLRSILRAAFDQLRDASYAVGFTLEQLLQGIYDGEWDEMRDETRMQMDHFLADNYALREVQV